MSRASPLKTRRRLLVCRLVTLKCIGHALTVVLYVFQLALVALAVVLGWMLVRDDIPVPAFLHGRIEQELARFGLEASFDSVQFDPAGRLLVQGLRLQPARFSEPVFLADTAFIALRRLELLSGNLVPARIEAEGVRIVCPSSISPSGIPEILVRISAVRVLHDRGTWTLDGLSAQTTGVQVSARGTYVAVAPDEKQPLPDLDAILARFAKLAPRLVRARESLAAVRSPAIDIVFNGRGREVTIDATLSAEGWEHPQFGDVAHARLETSVRLNGAALAEPLRVRGHIGHAQRDGTALVTDIDVAAEWQRLPSEVAPWPDRLRVALQRARHPKVGVHSLVADVRPAAFPEFSADLAFELEGMPIEAALTGNAETRSGIATVQGRLGRTWMAKASEILGRDVTYYLDVDEPPDFAATAHIDPGLKWREVVWRCLAGPIGARGVHLDRARVLGRLTPEKLRVHHLEMSRGDEHAAGTYEDTLKERNYRFLLRGAMRPHSISKWFGPWWGNFWKDYTFDAAAPLFDVDVHGQWKQGHNTFVWGDVSAQAATVRGRAFDDVATKFFVRPNYYDLHDAALLRAEGRIDGEVQLYFRPGEKIPARQEWEFRSTADLVELAGIFGEGGDRILEGYRYETPPSVQATGRITQESGAYETDISLRLETPVAFRYWDFPLESLSTSVTIHNKHVELPDIRARYSGGAVSGNALVDNGTITFDGKLEDADYDLAVENYREFQNLRAPQPTEEQEKSGFAAKKVGGRLDLTLAASGPLLQYDAYEGSGHARIRDGDLAQINLFGPLGDALNGIGIKLGTLSLNELEAPFEVRRERLEFPRLKVTGNNGALITEGAYFLRDGTVNFKARLYPLRESSGFFTQFFGILLEPISSLLEMRLTGTLQDPNWSFTRDPRAILRELARKKEAEEEAARQAAESALTGEAPPRPASEVPEEPALPSEPPP